ncbi:hypothetical protein OROMI_018218 [Orobanche minor]
MLIELRKYTNVRERPIAYDEIYRLKNSMLNFGKVILLVRCASARQHCPPDFDRMTNPVYDRESLVADDSTALVPGEQNEQRSSEQELSNDFEERMILIHRDQILKWQEEIMEVRSLGVAGSFSTKLETGKTLAKGGNDYWKSIGLRFKHPVRPSKDKESLVEDDSTALVPGEQNEQRASEQVRIDMAHILLFWSELEKLVVFMRIPLIVVFFVVLLASFLLPHLSVSLFATCMLRPFICQLLLPLPSCVVSLTSASSLHLTAPSSLTVALHNFIDIVVEGLLMRTLGFTGSFGGLLG